MNGLQAIKQRINMILDSGTTLIIAPKAAATEFWAKIPTSKKYDDNFWVYRCDTPPTIDFGFTRVFQHWSMDVEETFNLGNIAEDPDYCMGAVATQDLGLGTSWILGDAASKSRLERERAPRDGYESSTAADRFGFSLAVLNWYVIHVSRCS